MANEDVRLEINLLDTKRDNGGLYARASYSQLLATEADGGRYTHQWAKYMKNYVS